MVCFKNSSIVLRLLTNEDREEVHRLEAEVFTSRVSLDKLLSVDADQHYNAFIEFLEEDQTNTLSTVAVDVATGKIIAAMISSRFTPSSINKSSNQTISEGPLIKRVIESLNGYWDSIFKSNGYSPNSDTFLYFMMGFTSSSYMNQGIFTTLYHYTENYLRSQGIRYIFVMIISKEMRRLLINKLGYKALAKILYSEISVGGEPLLAKLIEQKPEFKTETITFGIKEL